MAIKRERQRRMEQDELQILAQQIQAIDTKFQTLRGYL